jgi:hypothetical protein
VLIVRVAGQVHTVPSVRDVAGGLIHEVPQIVKAGAVFLEAVRFVLRCSDDVPCRSLRPQRAHH